MAKTNYHQARRQKETARKARQQEKLARKLARTAAGPEGDAVQSGEEGAAGPVTDLPVTDEPATDAKVQP